MHALVGIYIVYTYRLLGRIEFIGTFTVRTRIRCNHNRLAV